MENNWVWTEKAEGLHSERKAGELVDTRYMMKGAKEYFPYASWIQKGYVNKRKQDTIRN